MSSPLISSGPLLSPQCSARVCHCIRLLTRWWSVGKADLLSDHLDSKQSREAVDLPLTCYPSTSLTTFAFMSGEVRHLLFELDPYGGTDIFGIFPLFLKRTYVMAPRLSVVFRRLVRL